MLFKKDKATLADFEAAIQYEWLETNGLGGWCSSTVIGCNTRRYHGLLVAATNPPAERMCLVSKLDETIVSDGNRYELGTNNYGSAIHPQGYQFLSSFSKELFPEFIYEAGGVILKKSVAALHGENTTILIYEVLKAPGTFQLELLPLVSVRGYHSLMHANESIHQQVEFDNGTFRLRAYDNTPEIFIQVPGAQYLYNPHWYYNFNYGAEKERGLDYIEDLFSHGHFVVELKQGDSLGIIISTENPLHRNAHDLLAGECQRRQLLLNKEAGNEIFQTLILAADQFIVGPHPTFPTTSREGRVGASIIAGYHWFTDWGRDTMISLPGLCLATGRFEDAKKILSAFSKSVSQGMLPNRFQDNNEPPEYNNVDGTLWYFIAIYQYMQATGDNSFALREMLPVLKEIISWHLKGTRFNIHATEDGLLYAGEKGQQLTWMDARIGDWVVTPRMGKPVEVQALWYNALCIFASLLRLNNEMDVAADMAARAAKAKSAFNRLFWYEEGRYLYDVIDENDKPDTSFRPNQLFAISLPFALIDDKSKSTSILNAVTQQLYTPPGLRSLSASDPNYIGTYGGNQLKRDACYHQGTVWSWLLGPYIDALIKTNGSLQEAKDVIDRFVYHLSEAGIGSVSEIFDGNEPHHPRGCIAQAWGVAELLRIIKEYKLL